MDRATFRALRHAHGYPQFLTAATVARVGDEMFAVGVVLLVLERTGSPSLAGATIAAATLPGVLSAPLVGAWLDRTGRRSLIYKIDRLVLVGVLLAILAAAGHAPNFVVLLLAVMTGLTMPVSWTGFTSMIPLIVQEEMLPSANAVEAASLNVGLIAGPALAGLVAGAIAPGAAIIAEVCLTLVALVLILRIPDLDRRGHSSGGGDAIPLRTIVADGLRHIVHEPVLRVVSAAGFLNNVGWGVLIIVFPVWADVDLGSSSSASGAIWAAFASGSLLGALGLARLQVRYAQEWVVFFGMIATGLGMATWALVDTLPLAIVLVALTAVVEGPTMAAVFSLRQQRTPPELMAQVMGTIGSAQIGAFAIGSALGGPVVLALGPRSSILVVAATVVIAAAVGALVRSRVQEPAAARPAR